MLPVGARAEGAGRITDATKPAPGAAEPVPGLLPDRDEGVVRPPGLPPGAAGIADVDEAEVRRWKRGVTADRAVDDWMRLLLLHVGPFEGPVRRVPVEGDRGRRLCVRARLVQVDGDPLPVALVKDVVVAQKRPDALSHHAETLADIYEAACRDGGLGLECQARIRALEFLERGRGYRSLDFFRGLFHFRLACGVALRVGDMLTGSEDAERL